MKNGSWLIVALASGLAGCSPTLGARALPPLPAGVQARASEQHYEVTGTSVAEIRLSMRTAATRTLGPRVLGRHEWNLQWSYNYQQVGGTCSVTEVTIDLSSVIVVPRWTDREEADSTLIAQWDAYITDLRGHEYGHRTHSYRAAREISRELGRIQAPSCASVTSRARSRGQEILDKYKQIDVDWDADPENSVSWPPRRVGGTEHGLWPSP